MPRRCERQMPIDNSIPRVRMTSSNFLRSSKFLGWIMAEEVQSRNWCGVVAILRSAHVDRRKSTPELKHTLGVLVVVKGTLLPKHLHLLVIGSGFVKFAHVARQSRPTVRAAIRFQRVVSWVPEVIRPRAAMQKDRRTRPCHSIEHRNSCARVCLLKPYARQDAR